jgi:hypothetical protein
MTVLLVRVTGSAGDSPAALVTYFRKRRERLQARRVSAIATGI